MNKLFKVGILLLLFIALTGCSDPVKGNKYSVYYERAIEEGVTELGYEAWLDSFRKDESGEFELKIEDDVMLWQYVDDSSWVVLYDFNPKVETVDITFLYEDAWMDGLSNESILTINKGESLKLPTPFKTGYSFLGWFYSDVVIDEVYLFEENATLTSRWEVIDYELKLWHPTNTELIGVYTYHYGDSLELPTIEVEGTRFLGWYKDPLLTEPLDFETMPSQNLELFAKLVQTK